MLNVSKAITRGMMDQSTFSANLKKKMADKKLSGVDLARALGVTTTTISRWRSSDYESGPPPLRKRKLLAAVLQVDPSVFDAAAGAHLSVDTGSGLEFGGIPEEDLHSLAGPRLDGSQLEVLTREITTRMMNGEVKIALEEVLVMVVRAASGERAG